MSAFAIFGTANSFTGASRLVSESLVAIFGTSRGDYTRYPLEVGEHKISAVAIFGSVSIVLPEDAAIEMEVVNILGSSAVRSEGGMPLPDPATAARQVKISGVAIFGSVNVRRVPVGTERAASLLEQRDYPQDETTSYEGETARLGHGE